MLPLPVEESLNSTSDNGVGRSTWVFAFDVVTYPLMGDRASIGSICLLFGVSLLSVNVYFLKFFG